MLWEPFKITVPSRYSETKLPMAHTDLSVAFSLQHTAVDNCAMNKFGICMQQRNEHFKPRMLLFSVGNSGTNARYNLPLV